MPAIRYTLPSSWRALEAKQAVVAAAKLLEHDARHGIKSEGLALLRSELRGFASASLVGRPGNQFLDDYETSQLGSLITRVFRLSTSEAANAGKPQPPVALLTRIVSAVNAREQREFSGGFGAAPIQVL